MLLASKKILRVNGEPWQKAKARGGLALKLKICFVNQIAMWLAAIAFAARSFRMLSEIIHDEALPAGGCPGVVEHFVQTV